MLNQYRYFAGQFEVGFHVFKLTGTDVREFLQDQSTYDLNLLLKKSFHLVSFLDPQGRIEVYGWLLKEGTDYLYLVPESLKDAANERLNRYLISEDVNIEGPYWETWTVVLGSQSHQYKSDNSFSGIMFADTAIIQRGSLLPEISTLENEEIELWRALTGWPTFSGSDFKKEIINNLYLYDLSLVPNKGCYPGQETVSKIANNRGAAYAPILIETNKKNIPTGEILNFGKKIGASLGYYEWDEKNYLTANLLRDFRVKGLKIKFSIDQIEDEGIVHYYPLIPGTNQEKAEELFHSAMEHFKKDNYESAEECLKLAIELNPKYADAYESLGVLLGRLERFSEAILYMRKLSEIDPYSVLAHTNMSLFLMRMGKIEEAEQEKSLATVKSFQKFGEEAKAKRLLEEEKKKEQEELLRRESMFLQVLEIDSEDTLANYGLGSIAVEREEWIKAIKYLEKVISADPKYSVAYLALGRAYKGDGQIEKAKDTWSKGIAVAAAKGDLMPANQMQSELQRL
ncbi:MAG: tetratricopeptide repeat protein [Bacteriovoracaceae bacterium]